MTIFLDILAAIGALSVLCLLIFVLLAVIEIQQSRHTGPPSRLRLVHFYPEEDSA